MRYTGPLRRCGNAEDTFLRELVVGKSQEQDEYHVHAPLTTVRKHGEGREVVKLDQS